MHSASVYYYQGWWYGRCECGWVSGGFLTEDNAWGACTTHEQSQRN